MTRSSPTSNHRRPAGDGGWLSVRIEPDRAAEVNRALAAGGIYASGIETGSGLESLFLELTASEASANHEGTFGPAGSNAPPPILTSFGDHPKGDGQ